MDQTERAVFMVAYLTWIIGEGCAVELPDTGRVIGHGQPTVRANGWPARLGALAATLPGPHRTPASAVRRGRRAAGDSHACPGKLIQPALPVVQVPERDARDDIGVLAKQAEELPVLFGLPLQDVRGRRRHTGSVSITPRGACRPPPTSGREE